MLPRPPVLFLLLVAALAGIVLAQPVQQSAYDALCRELSARPHFIWLPQTVGSFFQNKIINLNFQMTTLTGEDWRVYGVVGSGKIGQVRCGRTEAADYDVSMSDRMAIDLATSLTPITTFAAGWKSGRIRIEAHGAENAQRLKEGEANLTSSDGEPVPQAIRTYFEGWAGGR